MDITKFEEVINFAIEREYEAALFYRNLQNIVKQPASKSMLKDLEDMELGHAEYLKNISNQGIEEFQIPKLLDLKISDYMVDNVPQGETTNQEILVIAMKREEAAKQMYLKLAGEFEAQETKNLFLKMASEEAKHKLMLESLYDDEFLTEN
jgi:rubrerythrin